MECNALQLINSNSCIVFLVISIARVGVGGMLPHLQHIARRTARACCCDSTSLYTRLAHYIVGLQVSLLLCLLFVCGKGACQKPVAVRDRSEALCSTSMAGPASSRIRSREQVRCRLNVKAALVECGVAAPP